MRTILIPLILFPLLAQAAVLSPSATINTVTAQRMLTQRIVKAYCQQGRGINSNAAKLQINSSITQFSTQLSNLFESVKITSYYLCNIYMF